MSGRAWSGAAIAAVSVAARLVAVTGVGIVQARRVPRLRLAVLSCPADPSLAEVPRRAAALRDTVATLALALIAVAMLAIVDRPVK